MSNLSPKPYGKTRELEITAISKFENLIDKKRVNAFIERDNTIPDTDGYIVIIDDRTIPICKFEVQIKKLPDKNEDDPKISCPVSIFGYAQSFFYPFLFIAVDIHKNKAYWIHINDTLLNQYYDKIEADQDSVTIHFPKDNFIDGNNTAYVNAWEKIFQNQALKLKNYDNLERQYSLLKEHSNPILGTNRSEFTEIHTFLDNLNIELETKFPIVKRVFFSNAWKLGIAYYEYTDDRLSYSLYPIPLDKNDVQIKIFDENLKRKLDREHLDIKGHYGENPIKTKSKNYSIEVIETKIFQIIKHRLLDHKNEFLAREFIIAFIDNFHIQLGLDIKSTYSIEEIETAFFRYLPLWTNETVQHLTSGNGKNKIDSSHHIFQSFFIDPDMINCLIMPDEKILIEERVKTQIKKNEPIPRIRMGNEKFPFGTFFELFIFLKSLGVNEIQRLYSQKNYQRLQTRKSWVWNVYSPEQVKENLSVFFNNLNDVYTSIIDKNFPEIKEKIPIFGCANRIIVVYNVEEDYDMTHSPTINCYYVVDDTLINKVVFEVYNKKECPIIPPDNQIRSDRDFSINGRKYQIISASRGVLGFIFDDIPMMDYCYKLLEENLKQYFKILKQE